MNGDDLFSFAKKNESRYENKKKIRHITQLAGESSEKINYFASDHELLKQFSYFVIVCWIDDHFCVFDSTKCCQRAERDMIEIFGANFLMGLNDCWNLRTDHKTTYLDDEIRIHSETSVAGSSESKFLITFELEISRKHFSSKLMRIYKWIIRISLEQFITR